MILIDMLFFSSHALFLLSPKWELTLQADLDKEE